MDDSTKIFANLEEAGSHRSWEHDTSQISSDFEIRPGIGVANIWPGADPRKRLSMKQSETI